VRTPSDALQVDYRVLGSQLHTRLPSVQQRRATHTAQQTVGHCDESPCKWRFALLPRVVHAPWLRLDTDAMDAGLRKDPALCASS
jgi:hypothetical protein